MWHLKQINLISLSRGLSFPFRSFSPSLFLLCLLRYHAFSRSLFGWLSIDPFLSLFASPGAVFGDTVRKQNTIIKQHLKYQHNPRLIRLWLMGPNCICSECRVSSLYCNPTPPALPPHWWSLFCKVKCS